ncbi:MAG TPA: response regulator [Verrucomicrobiae bacterium]|nr:response regulator [Verrucomicrobiae bacterium]
MNPKKILLVDDNEVVLKTLSLKLKTAGYHILTAMDGSQAVSAARLGKPDLILLDVNFPPEVAGVPWDGFRIIQWLRRMEETASVPIFVITGSQAAQHKERALKEGAIGFFQKPVNNDDLLAAIEKTLNQPQNPETTPP